QVEVLTGQELRELPRNAGTPPELPDAERTFAALFEEQVARRPEAPALVAHDGALSYAELDARANRLARHLAGLGVGPGDVVAVALPRSAELVTAVLAVLKSGAAYLPVDPGYPAQRLEFMLADAAPAVLLSDGPGARALQSWSG